MVCLELLNSLPLVRALRALQYFGGGSVGALNVGALLTARRHAASVLTGDQPAPLPTRHRPINRYL